VAGATQNALAALPELWGATRPFGRAIGSWNSRAKQVRDAPRPARNAITPLPHIPWRCHPCVRSSSLVRIDPGRSPLDSMERKRIAKSGRAFFARPTPASFTFFEGGSLAVILPKRAETIGDRAWHDVLDRHNALVRREISRHRGQEVSGSVNPVRSGDQ
jgi:hypothetical protein